MMTGSITILAVGDLHGDMGSAIELVDQHRPDLLLSPGDWGDPGQMSAALWDALLERVTVATVSGNHDDADLLAGLRNRDGSPVWVPNGEVHEILDLRIAGLNGIWAKSHRQPYYITDEDVDGYVSGISAPVDVLLTHGCPLGVVDLTAGSRHGGQRCFMHAFQALNPRLYICGHLHRAQRHVTKDGALMLNTGAGSGGDYYVVRWSGGEASLSGA